MLYKNYIDKKLAELTAKYISYGDVMARLNDLVQMVKMGRVELNADSLTETKADPRVAGIVLANVHIIDHLEIFADKIRCGQMEMSYRDWLKRQAKLARVGGASASSAQKVSKDTQSIIHLCVGLAKNISAGVPKPAQTKPYAKPSDELLSPMRGSSRREVLDRQQLMSTKMKHIMISPAENTSKFSKLSHIHLAGLSLSDRCWEQIALGIERTRVLRTLKINMTKVGREALKMLATAMRQNLSIDTIDLSYNGIPDSDGDILARIITN